MEISPASDAELEARIQVDVHLDDLDPQREVAKLAAGLVSPPRRISSRYFYDERGSRLFEEITRLPEYYLTRAERRLLESEAPTLAERVRSADLVELGSGAATKTRVLLDPMVDRGLQRYVPFDVDETTVRRTARLLAARYPGLEIHGVVGDFMHHLEHIPAGERRLVAFLGSTLGNLDRAASIDFLRAVAARLRPAERLLLGLDLIKDPRRLVAAYNDSAGVTARFNRNILRVMNRLLEANFEPRAFDHRALWNAAESRMEIGLVARSRQRVRLAAVGRQIEIDSGEEIRTEISCKYSRPGSERMLAEGGLELVEWLVDDGRHFALALAAPLA